jgi:hypothetical protein
MKTFVTFAWYSYLWWGPLITLAGLVLGIIVNWDSRLRLVRYVVAALVLTVIAGPASEEGWPMTWWMLPYLGSRDSVLYVWQYAMFCLVVQIAFGSLVFVVLKAQAKRRASRTLA